MEKLTVEEEREGRGSPHLLMMTGLIMSMKRPTHLACRCNWLGGWGRFFRFFVFLFSFQTDELPISKMSTKIVLPTSS